MNRLQSELHRLYLLRAPGAAGVGEPGGDLVDPAGRVRAMVMELAKPPSWEVLSKVWHGVQAELDLPAPAIAVSGVDGLQLWFSLEAPVDAARAHAFLEALRSRFLPDVDAGRLRLMPAARATAPGRAPLHAQPVPALQQPGGNWSAFVAPDLAPVFADTPWLDIPPGEEGQAALLRGLRMIEPSVFEAASKRLEPAAEAAPDVSGQTLHAPPTGEAATATRAAEAFLRRVMDDESVALALRIEAAKALLQHAGERRE